MVVRRRHGGAACRDPEPGRVALGATRSRRGPDRRADPHPASLGQSLPSASLRRQGGRDGDDPWPRPSSGRGAGVVVPSEAPRRALRARGEAPAALWAVSHPRCCCMAGAPPGRSPAESSGGAKRSHGSHRAGARDVSGAAGGTGSTGHTACQDIGNPSHRTRYHVRRLRRQGWATPRNTAATRRARASVPETPSRRSAATCTAPQAGSKSGKRAPCVFRAQVATHAGRNLPPIPGEGCHACRWKAATAAGCNRPPLQGYWRTRRRSHTPRGIVHLAQPRREAQRPAQRLSMRHVRAV